MPPAPSRPIIRAVTALIATVASASAAEPRFARVTVGGWRTAGSGDLAYAESGVQPAQASLGELGIDEPAWALQLEADLDLPLLLGVHAGFASFSTEGSGTLQRSIVFGDAVFTADDRVDGELSVDDAWGEIGIEPLDTPVADLGIGLGVHLQRVDLRLRSELTGRRDRFDEDIAIPVLAMRGRLSPLPWLAFEARAHLFALSLDSLDGTFLDARLQLAVTPLPWLGAVAGWRTMRYDLDASRSGDRVSVDADLSGFFAGALVQF